MTRILRRLAAATATVVALTALSTNGALAATLTPPPPAGAACEASDSGTVCTWDEVFRTPFPVPYGVSCGAFTVRVNLAGERHVIAFYDAAGALARRIRHASYEGALINSVTGASVPHEGRFQIFDDYGAGTTTITGRLSRTVIPGEGLVWRNIGRIQMSLATGAVLFEAGEHGTWDVLGDPSIAEDLCAALS
jgi:hypothetical protein